MGIELVEGRDLIVDGGIVYMKTIHGLKRVDVIYRRVDDEFLDSLTFRSDSILGVPGLMGAYRAGNVALANAVGNGVADDKAIYAYVPDVHPLLPGRRARFCDSVETYICAKPDDLAYVLDHLPELVVKAVGESGGYGMLIGPASDAKKIEDFRERIQANPRNYIAQPVIALSRVPSYDPATGTVGGRHVDLRPYCLYDGQKVTIVPGGLTRVALAARFAGGEFFAGRRQQRHLGSAGRRLNALAHRGIAFLAGALHRARRGHRAHSRRELPHAARAIPAVLPLALGAADHHGRRGKAFSPAATARRTPKTFSSFLPSGRTIPAPSSSASAKARENARTIRDRISREMWEDINGLYHTISRFNPAG